MHKFLEWIHSKKKRIEIVKIHPRDTWNMDHTLSLIILPMLKQLKATKHGAPHVEDSDVPEEFRSTSAPKPDDCYDIDDFHFDRFVKFPLINLMHNVHDRALISEVYKVKTDKKYFSCGTNHLLV
jgi:hypothetical protein